MSKGIDSDNIVPLLKEALYGNIALHFPKLWSFLLTSITADNALDVVKVFGVEIRASSSSPVIDASILACRQEILRVCMSYLHETQIDDLSVGTTSPDAAQTSTSARATEASLKILLSSLSQRAAKASSARQMQDLDKTISIVKRIMSPQRAQDDKKKPSDAVAAITQCLPIVRSLLLLTTRTGAEDPSLDLTRASGRAQLLTLCMLVRRSPDGRLKASFHDYLFRTFDRDETAHNGEYPLCIKILKNIQNLEYCPKWVSEGDIQLAREAILSYIAARPHVRSAVSLGLSTQKDILSFRLNNKD